MALLEKLRIVTQNEDENPPEILPEEVDGFPQSPVPGERPAPRRTKSTRSTARTSPASKPATAKLAKEVAADIASLIQGTAVVWGLTDQCCAPVLEQQAKPIADALTPILARNPKLLAKLAQGDMAVMVVQFIALGRALAPVATTIYSNHVAKTDEVEADNDSPDLPLDHFPVFGGIPRDAA